MRLNVETSKPIPEKDAELKKHKEYAYGNVQSRAPHSTLVCPRGTCQALQKRALRKEVPYQTLIASILHKYVDGQFQEKAPN